MVNINYLNIKQKLSEQLSNSGWDIVDRYLFSDEFQKTLEHLVGEVNDSKRFTPKIKNVFRAFKECHHDNLKVVIMAQDPYPTLGVADGLAFSSSVKKEETIALKTMFDELEKHDDTYVRNPDLTRWAAQGVLLTYVSFTTQLNTIGSHHNLWKGFVKDLVIYMNDNMEDIVFVFMGEEANKFSAYINKHPALYCSLPSSVIFREKWKSNDIFNSINNKLKKFNKDEIVW